MESQPTVIISGFGPFGIHAINASWESVKMISKSEIEKNLNVKLLTIEIPVVYDQVDKVVPTLWKQYDPILFVHVGVSSLASELVLETKANSENYIRQDCDDKLPIHSRNYHSGKECCEIYCKLNVDKISSDFNDMSKDIQTTVSKNAGRYLCEYIYFTSLSINPERTLFVHVPELNNPYSSIQIARGLEVIIRLCLLQLKNCMCITTSSM